MQKDINTLVLERLFGNINIEKKAVEEKDVKRGFYADSFYITGMTYEEYKAWSKRRQVMKGNYLFWQ